MKVPKYKPMTIKKSSFKPISPVGKRFGRSVTTRIKMNPGARISLSVKPNRFVKLARNPRRIK